MALPSEFTALYRLFLRATSAAVLHNGPATRGLRRLYRPTFEAAALAVRRSEGLDPSSGNAGSMRKWLATFDERINNTLSFLHTSSLSRGLPHRVVSRLSLLNRSYYDWNVRRLDTLKRTWNPKLDPKSPEYSTMPPSIYARNIMKGTATRARDAEFSSRLWGSLGEVIQMAEGRDGLVMGRVRFKRQEFVKKRFY